MWELSTWAGWRAEGWLRWKLFWNPDLRWPVAWVSAGNSQGKTKAIHEGMCVLSLLDPISYLQSFPVYSHESCQFSGCCGPVEHFSIYFPGIAKGLKTSQVINNVYLLISTEFMLLRPTKYLKNSPLNWKWLRDTDSYRNSQKNQGCSESLAPASSLCWWNSFSGRRSEDGHTWCCWLLEKPSVADAQDQQGLLVWGPLHMWVPPIISALALCCYRRSWSIEVSLGLAT